MAQIAHSSPDDGTRRALQIIGVSAAMGVVGVVTGFALFIMTWEESFSIAQLVLILAALGLFVSMFEYVRDIIDGEEHQFRPSRIAARLLLAATFELFVLAMDAALTTDWNALGKEIGTPVLGITLANRAGAVPNLFAMIALWVLIGSALGGGLALAISGLDGRPRAAKNGWRIGLVTGAVAAPLLVVAYILAARLVSEFRWMLAKPGEWTQNLDNLYKWITFWPLRAILYLPLQVGLMFHNSVWGPILFAAALLVIVVVVLTMDNSWGLLAAAAVVIVFGAPLLGPSLYSDTANAARLVLLVAIVWGVPGLLLGIAVPYLRRPSESRRVWGAAAWAAAASMVAFVALLQLNGWLLLLAPALIATGVMFWRGLPVEEYWPVIALCVGIIVLGMTQVTQSAHLLNIQTLSGSLVNEPLSRVSPPHDTRIPDLSSRYLDQFLTPGVNPLGTFLQPSFPFQAQMPTLQTWLDDVGREASKVQRLLDNESRQPPVLRIRDQAVLDTRLAGELATGTRTLMSQVADAQSDTENLTGGAQDRLAAISSEIDALTALRRREAAVSLPLSQVLFGILPPEKTRAERSLEAMLQDLNERKSELTDATTALRTAYAGLQARLAIVKVALAQHFERCLNGALGFWVSLGLLAGWSRYKRA